MRVDVATIFPGMFAGPLGSSILARAQEEGLLQVLVHDLRDYSDDRHRAVDDEPYGGGAGMVMCVQPFFEFKRVLLEDPRRPAERPHVILFSPSGRRLGHEVLRRLAGLPWLALLCGHYEGVDERVRIALCDEEISLGDYVLTGGELPAMVLLDAVVRLLPGVLGSPGSLVEESFARGTLEYPQYTRPAEFAGHRVPDVLLSGNHAAIAAWRHEEALRRTAERRPDLLQQRRGDEAAEAQDEAKRRSPVDR
jgi:tRNA (guanine37-N1)-methyltransferase